MKGVRFYIEYDSSQKKRKDVRSGNVVATFPEEPANPGRVAGVMGVYFYANSPVTFGEIGLDFLHTQCKRVSEKEARAEGHTYLFDMVERILVDEDKRDRLRALIASTPNCVGVQLVTGASGAAFYCYECAIRYNIAEAADSPESVATEFSPILRHSGASFMRVCDGCHEYLDLQGTPAAGLTL